MRQPRYRNNPFAAKLEQLKQDNPEVIVGVLKQNNPNASDKILMNIVKSKELRHLVK